MAVLTLQQSLQLLELLHRLVLQVGVGNLQADAVQGPGQLTGEHLCKDPRHHRYHLHTHQGHLSKARISNSDLQLLQYYTEDMSVYADHNILFLNEYKTMSSLLLISLN